jgi:hypothetical protein
MCNQRRSIDNFREKLYATQPELKIVLKEMHPNNELFILAPPKETYPAFQSNCHNEVEIQIGHGA